jgi:hypothetical protein
MAAATWERAKEVARPAMRAAPERLA